MLLFLLLLLEAHVEGVPVSKWIVNGLLGLLVDPYSIVAAIAGCEIVLYVLWSEFYLKLVSQLLGIHELAPAIYVCLQQEMLIHGI